MPLATISDVEERLGRNLTTAEDARVSGLLDEASDQVIPKLRPEFLSPVPGAVSRVVSRMVARILETPPSDPSVQGQQFTAGPFQMSNTFTPDTRSGSPWLTKADLRALRPYVFGAFSVRTY